MEEMNPKKKSRAFIITFVFILVLLIAGYFLFKKQTAPNVKGEVKGNIFSSLFGLSKQKNLDSLPDGVSVDADGNLIDKDGNLVDKDGNLIDKNGNLIDKNGNIITIDKDGNLIDKNGNIITVDKDGIMINKDGEIIGRYNRPGDGPGTGPGGGPGAGPDGTGPGGGPIPYTPILNPIPNPNSRPDRGTCFDKIQNGNETGVDTGGDCVRPERGTCSDRIQNGTETGIDIGGDCSRPDRGTCFDGIKNGKETGIDIGGDCGPQRGTCSDGIKNGKETDIDVGGDCSQPDRGTCFDGIQNGRETGVDTGGDCGPPLPYPNSGTCYDGAKNGDETGIDTGGRCGVKPQCSDGIDNDKDGKIDTLDSSCHTDFVATNVSSYDATIDDEAKVKPLYCPDDPLENYFTETQKKELANLTREFYRISATLHTAEDINTEYASRRTYNDLIAQAEALTNQCVAQTIPGVSVVAETKTQKIFYKGPTERRRNPYMSSDADFLKKYKPLNPSAYTNTTYMSGINFADKEPPIQSLYEISKIIEGAKESKLTVTEEETLRLLISHTLGRAYEEGAPLPNSYLYNNLSLFIKDPVGGNWDFKDFTDSDHKFTRDDYMAVKLMRPMDEKTFVYALDTATTQDYTSHTNSCDGYVDYEGKALMPTGFYKIISYQNDIYTNPASSAENKGGKATSTLSKLGHSSVLNNPNLKLSDFPGANEDLALSTNKFFYAVYSYISYTQELMDVMKFGVTGIIAYDLQKYAAAREAFPFRFISKPLKTNYVLRMPVPDQHACNDIYGLKLLLKKTTDINTIKNYMSQTICEGKSYNKFCYSQQAPNPNYYGYGWIDSQTMKDSFKAFEDMFSIW